MWSGGRSLGTWRRPDPRSSPEFKIIKPNGQAALRVARRPQAGSQLVGLRIAEFFEDRQRLLPGCVRSVGFAEFLQKVAKSMQGPRLAMTVTGVLADGQWYAYTAAWNTWPWSAASWPGACQMRSASSLPAP
jgi:hypothetical protein